MDLTCRHGHHDCLLCEQEAKARSEAVAEHYRREQVMPRWPVRTVAPEPPNRRWPVRQVPASEAQYVGTIPERREISVAKPGQLLILTKTGWEWQDPPVGLLP